MENWQACLVALIKAAQELDYISIATDEFSEEDRQLALDLRRTLAKDVIRWARARVRVLHTSEIEA